MCSYALETLLLCSCLLLTGTCSSLSLSNGEVHYSVQPVNGRYPIATEAIFLCQAGYYIDGYVSTICVPNGSSVHWTNPTPQCLLSN